MTNKILNPEIVKKIVQDLLKNEPDISFKIRTSSYDSIYIHLRLENATTVFRISDHRGDQNLMSLLISENTKQQAIVDFIKKRIKALKNRRYNKLLSSINKNTKAQISGTFLQEHFTYESRYHHLLKSNFEKGIRPHYKTQQIESML